MTDNNQNIHMNVMIKVTILVLKASNANNNSNHADDNMEYQPKVWTWGETVLDPEPLKLNAYGTELPV